MPAPDAMDGTAVPPGATAGILRVHLDGEPPHLHPLIDADESIARIVVGTVYDTLLGCESGTYRPSLAERWDVSGDGLKITLHLRPGVRWHDGRGFGPLDVETTLSPLIRPGPGLPLLRADLADVASVEIAQGGIVRLRLRRPSDLALRALCDVPILPEHLIRGWSQELSPVARVPVGTGPFRFIAWERGKRIRLQRVRDPWAGPAAIAEIVFEIDGDLARALLRTREGEIDVLPRVADVHYPAEVEPVTLRGSLSLYRLRPERTSFLVVNHRRPPLSDARFREALGLLWDRPRFAREAHRGLARPIGGPPWSASGPAAQAFDPKAAIVLLERTGYRDGDGDGVREHGGKLIRLVLLLPSGARSAAVEARAYMLELRKAGLLLDVRTADASPLAAGGFQARLRDGDFDLAPLVWQGRADEDPTPLYGGGGAFNFGAWRSAAADALIEDLRLAPGPEARRPILARLGALIASERPMIFLYRHDTAALVSKRVHGLAAVGDRLDYRRVWVEPR